MKNLLNFLGVVAFLAMTSCASFKEIAQKNSDENSDSTAVDTTEVAQNYVDDVYADGSETSETEEENPLTVKEEKKAQSLISITFGVFEGYPNYSHSIQVFAHPVCYDCGGYYDYSYRNYSYSYGYSSYSNPFSSGYYYYNDYGRCDGGWNYHEYSVSYREGYAYGNDYGRNSGSTYSPRQSSGSNNRMSNNSGGSNNRIASTETKRKNVDQSRKVNQQPVRKNETPRTSKVEPSRNQKETPRVDKLVRQNTSEKPRADKPSVRENSSTREIKLQPSRQQTSGRSVQPSTRQNTGGGRMNTSTPVRAGGGGRGR